jgi:hypothetical protein
LTPAIPRIKLTDVPNFFARIVKLLTPKRRWAQFSLATLFVVVTVLCVALALVVVPAERQRRAVAAIEAIGGSVEYVEPDETVSEAFPKRFLRRWLPPDYFDEVCAVDFDGTDADLAHLHGLTRLRFVNLRGAQVTDAGLAHLPGLTGLERLYLDSTQVTGAGLVHLQGISRLHWLSLRGTRVTDTGLAHLEGLPGLQKLWLRGTQVTDVGLTHLQGLPGLRFVGLEGTQVTDAGLAQLRRARPKCQVYSGP